MKIPRVSLLSVLTVAVLAGGTLTVFGRLQNYGPQSAIRRFHLAVAEDNSADLQRVVLQPVTSPDVLELKKGVMILTSNGPYQISRMDRRPGEVAVAAIYSLPPPQTLVVIWVTVKDGRDWKVDAKKTLDLLKMRG